MLSGIALFWRLCPSVFHQRLPFFFCDHSAVAQYLLINKEEIIEDAGRFKTVSDIEFSSSFSFFAIGESLIRFFNIDGDPVTFIFIDTLFQDLRPIPFVSEIFLYADVTHIGNIFVNEEIGHSDDSSIFMIDIHASVFAEQSDQSVKINSFISGK